MDQAVDAAGILVIFSADDRDIVLNPQTLAQTCRMDHCSAAFVCTKIRKVWVSAKARMCLGLLSMGGKFPKAVGHVGARSVNGKSRTGEILRRRHVRCSSRALPAFSRRHHRRPTTTRSSRHSPRRPARGDDPHSRRKRRPAGPRGAELRARGQRAAATPRPRSGARVSKSHQEGKGSDIEVRPSPCFSVTSSGLS